MGTGKCSTTPFFVGIQKGKIRALFGAVVRIADSHNRTGRNAKSGTWQPGVFRLIGPPVTAVPGACLQGYQMLGYSRMLTHSLFTSDQTWRYALQPRTGG